MIAMGFRESARKKSIKSFLNNKTIFPDFDAGEERQRLAERYSAFPMSTGSYNNFRYRVNRLAKSQNISYDNMLKRIKKDSKILENDEEY